VNVKNVAPDGEATARVRHGDSAPMPVCPELQLRGRNWTWFVGKEKAWK